MCDCLRTQKYFLFFSSKVLLLWIFLFYFANDKPLHLYEGANQTLMELNLQDK